MVVDYEEASGRYLAVPCSPAQQQPAIGQRGAGGTWVPRISLCFMAEDPFVYARR